MAVSAVDFGQQLLVYTAILVAAPLVFVLLFRAMDYFALDEVTEQFTQRPQDWQMYGDHQFDEEPTRKQVDDTNADHLTDDVPSDWVPCPRCGTRNGPEYTFCRSCLARIGV